jgi:hypothetical protein
VSEELTHYRAFEIVAAEVLDEADRIIAINCGTDTPKEWDRAFHRFAKARAALATPNNDLPTGNDGAQS